MGLGKGNKKEDRNYEYLVNIVEDIYEVFKDTERYLDDLYPNTFKKKLPEK